MQLDSVELDWLRRSLIDAGEDAGALQAELITGGRSNLTFLLTDGRTRWVMRMPPRAGRTPSAHDIAREYRVTSGLARAGFPVPRPIVLHEDDSPLGGPLVIAEFVKGRTVQSQIHLAAIDDRRVGQAVDALVETIVALHAIDYAAVGLERFGRPDGYAQRQLDRWAGQWNLVTPGDVSLDRASTELANSLASRVPGQARSAIIHGDYRIDNTLLDLTSHRVRVAAVVDWELSTLGDPTADLAMMCAYRNPAFDLVLGTEAAWTSPRLPSAHDLASRYADLAGTDLPDWDFHLALAYFKVSVISAGIALRHHQNGGADGGDSAALAVEPYLAAGLNVLQ